MSRLDSVAPVARGASMPPEPNPDPIAAPQSVASILRERIVQGDLLPGAPLREVLLADELAVSRNTLRQAFSQLASENLVDIRRHRGAVVRVMTVDDVRDIYLVRRTVEPGAVDRSDLATRDATTLLDQRATQVVAAGAAGQWREVATESLRFHQALVATLGSPRMDAFFATVVAQIRLAFAGVAEVSQFQAPFVARDRQICDLLLAGARAAAAASLRQYLDDAEQAVIDAVAP